MKRTTPSATPCSSKRRSGAMKSKLNPFKAQYWPTQTASVPQLPGREKHVAALWKILEDNCDAQRGITVYCFGQPGSGKTLTVELVAKTFCNKFDVPLVRMNCMKASMSAPEILRRIYAEILTSIGIEKKGAAGSTAKNLLDALGKLVQSLTSPVVLMLDEVDALDNSSIHQTSTETTLAKLWSLPSKGPLVILSIANTLDLYVRLKKSVSTSILRVKFLAYSMSECVTILKSRADQLGVDLAQGFKPCALDMLVKIVMNQEGDIRRVLDICDQLSHSHEVVELSDVVTMCDQTLQTSVGHDIKAIIKRLPVVRKLVLYGFCQQKGKVEKDADAQTQLELDEVMARFDENKEKISQVLSVLPKGFSVRDLKMIMDDLVTEGLLSKKVLMVGKKVKPGKQIYRLQFGVENVQQVLQAGLIEDVGARRWNSLHMEQHSVS